MKEKDRTAYVIGLTGSMGSGKSTAAGLLSGCMPVLDLDEVNRSLLLPEGRGTELLSQLSWVPVQSDGTVDRKELAARMFQDPDRRKQAESILHPLLWEAMDSWIRQQHGFCAVEVPLLFETGSQGRFDEIWCVTCSEATALQRLRDGRGYAEEEARQRLACQYPAADKAAASDVVLCNDGDPEDLKSQVLTAVQRLEKPDEQ